MTEKELKNSILQQAVEGKLVPQDPADEPASELLKQIEREKARLVKEGKIKKAKDASTIFRRDGHFVERKGKAEQIIDSELPFDIPDTWEWVRLGEVCHVEMGQSPDGESVSEKNDGIEFHQGKIYFGEKFLENSPKKTNKPTKIAEPNSVLLCVRAPVGKVNMLTRSICIGRGLCSIKPISDYYDVNFLYYLLTTYENEFSKKATGTTFKSISKDIVNEQLIPIPPLAEQERIVEKLDEVLPLVSEFGKIERELTSLEAGFPKKLKNSVLQQAVEGKLVPQDPADEPASELLKQIEREKARLVKEGKIKKPKETSNIFRRDGHFVERKGKTEQIIDSELPFDIPDTWEWVRLETIAFLQTGTTPATSKKEYFNGPVPFIKPADISPNGIDYDNESLSVEGAEYSRKIKANSVMMVCIGGSIGKCYYTNKDVCCNQQINTATPYLVSYKYLFYAMISDFFQKDVIFKAGGTATPIINKSIWGSLLIPLPPLAEQARIVEKLDVFMELEKELRAEADLRHKQLEHCREVS